MLVLEQKAQEVANIVTGTSSKGAGTAPGPGPILSFIITILKDVIGALGTCGLTPLAATARVNRGGPLERISVKRATKAQTKHGLAWSLVDPITHAALHVGTTCTETDVAAMMSGK